MSWHVTDDVDEFLDAVGDRLARRPVENSLLLTIARSLRLRGPHAHGPADPILGWRDDCVFLQTPPHPLLLGAGCPPELADLFADRPLTAVNGLTAEAEAFATRRHELTGAPSTVVQQTRLFRLAELVPPPMPAGAARVAGPADRDLLIEWFQAFNVEVGHAVPADSAVLVDDKLSFGGLTVWEVDGEIVSMAGTIRPEAGATRVAPVYTPARFRGRGYGAAVTAAVTRRALDDGADDVVLFTDITNPTSNALYQRLGYRPVEDRTVLEFSS